MCWGRPDRTRLTPVKRGVRNLVLVCRAHHWKIHEGGWLLLRSDEGLVTVRPLPRDLGPPIRIGPLARPRSGEPVHRLELTAFAYTQSSRSMSTG